MTPEAQCDRVFASAMQDRQALRRFLDGVTAIQARWHPPDGAWSILEGLGHSMLTEEFFRRRRICCHESDCAGFGIRCPPLTAQCHCL
jgi:hypothetical protein